MAVNRAPRRKRARKFKKLSKNTYLACLHLAKKFGHAELKSIVIEIDGHDMDSNGSTETMDSLAVGTNVDQRIGNRVTLLGVEFNGAYVGADFSNIGRAILYNKKDGYTITSSDITVGGLFYSQTTEMTQDITIYQDKFLPFGAPSQILAAASSYPTQKLRMRKLFPKGLNVQWNATPHIEKNSIQFSYWSDSTAASDPQLFGNLRYFYVDN